MDDAQRHEVPSAQDHARARELARELGFAELRFRTLTESGLDGVVVLDPGRRILYANPAAERLFSAPDRGLIGKAWTEPLPEPGEGLEAVMASTGARRVETRLTRSCWDGQEALLLTLRDVSRERELEQQLLHAQKMEAVGRLAGGVAHDFNNLLSAIMGYAELVKLQVGSESPMTGDVDEILRAAHSAAGLTRQLLAFGRRQLIQPRVVQLDELLDGMGRLLERVIGEDVRIERRVAPGLPPVLIDPGQFEQVVMNLAVNARDAMPTGGVLRFALGDGPPLGPCVGCGGCDREVGHYVVLEVSDTGIGMDATVRARVFEPFFTTKAPGKGTGLGLATVYGIVQQHGGRIELESEPGRGATFRICLPAVVWAPGEPRAVTVGGPVRGGHETILVVEDQEQLRGLCSRILRQAGYLVLTAPATDVALSLFEARGGDIELLLSDVVMPGASGVTLVETLRARRPELSVLLMSGHAGEDLAHHLAGHPEWPMLQKPFTAESLLRGVRQCLDRA